MPEDRQVTRLPLETRKAPLNSFDATARTATVVVAAGAAIRRYDWMRERYYSEELSMSPSAIDMTRINGQGVSVLNNHDQYSGLDAVLGRASNGRIENGQLLADVRFSQRDEVSGLVRDIGDGIITDVSVGYTRDAMEMVPPDTAAMNANRDAPWTYRVTRWTPMEVSFVTVPADPGAGMRNVDGKVVNGAGKEVRSFECAVTEVPTAVPAGAESTRKEVDMPEITTAPATEQNAEQRKAIEVAAASAATSAERSRSTEIRKIAKAAELPDADADGMIERGITVDAARTEAFDKMIAARKSPPVKGVAHIEMGEDESTKVRAAIGSAIEHRLDSSKTLADNGAADFRYMPMLRIAEELLTRRGIKTSGMPKLEMAKRAFGTTDFPNVLANVMNKRLRQGYDENPGTYQQWAYKAPNAPDFKSITVAQISAAPDFVLKNPGDELKYGSASDGKETYAAATYARGMGFTREAMINDDLRSFDRLVTGFGASARRLENRLVYIQLLANAALADGVALFHATHKNYTGTGTAISVASLGVSRTQMRKQTGLQGEVLNIVPKFLIVPAALENLAYQYTSSQFVPAISTSVNEFRQGGKTALTPIVEAQLDSLTSLDGVTDYSSALKWYLAADAGQVDTVEYCYVDGYDGVHLEQEVDFDTDALHFKGRLDFATKAIDFRGLTLNNGA
jgi:phage major head subunit gpT-like protein